MKKILGLDLGSTSVGWAFIHESEETTKIIGAGVRVVPISTDEATDFQKGNAISINKNRSKKIIVCRSKVKTLLLCVKYKPIHKKWKLQSNYLNFY